VTKTNFPVIFINAKGYKLIWK